jgi:rRNA maturation RNase YbeY
MMIDFYSKDTPFSFKGKQKSAKTKIKSVIKMEEKQGGNLCFIFCTNDFLLDINKKYLDHDYYTDVITFDYTVDNIVSGDVFISVEQVDENARKYGVSFEYELSRVIYHGVLHLCGYKDKSEDEERTMREKEDFYLKTLSTIQ